MSIFHIINGITVKDLWLPHLYQNLLLFSSILFIHQQKTQTEQTQPKPEKLLLGNTWPTLLKPAMWAPECLNRRNLKKIKTIIIFAKTIDKTINNVDGNDFQMLSMRFRKEFCYFHAETIANSANLSEMS